MEYTYILFPLSIQLMYRGYGGTSKGLSFKDLLCGLVILTKGTRDEKMKCRLTKFSTGLVKTPGKIACTIVSVDTVLLYALVCYSRCG